MNRTGTVTCGKARDWILLADSGELSARRRRLLDAHMARCPVCLAYSGEVRDLSRTVRAGLPTEPVSRMVRVRIRAEAEKRSAQALRPPILQRGWIRALACAACLAAVFGIWHHVRPTRPARQVENIRTLIAMISEHEQAAAQASNGGAETHLHTLARELLSMEGLALENDRDTDPDENLPTADEEPSPKALRERSTAFGPEQKYG